jgi:hypothetical protein
MREGILQSTGKNSERVREVPASTVLIDGWVPPDSTGEGKGILRPSSISRHGGGQPFLEKVCGRCGRPIANDQEMCGTEDGDLCMECWLGNECICPDGRFKIYLPDHSIKIVDFEEYEAVRRVFGDRVFIIGNLDEDPRRIKGRRESPEKGMDELVRLFIKETERGDMEDEEH